VVLFTQSSFPRVLVPEYGGIVGKGIVGKLKSATEVTGQDARIAQGDCLLLMKPI